MLSPVVLIKATVWLFATDKLGMVRRWKIAAGLGTSQHIYNLYVAKNLQPTSVAVSSNFRRLIGDNF